MKKIKRKTPSTDYFFESFFETCKSFIASNWPLKPALIRLIAIATWIKELN